MTFAVRSENLRRGHFFVVTNYGRVMFNAMYPKLTFCKKNTVGGLTPIPFRHSAAPQPFPLVLDLIGADVLRVEIGADMDA